MGQRREKGEGSFWQGKDGQWWAKATRHGRTLKARAADRADAKAKAKALAAELASGLDVDSARLTMRMWLTQWLESVKDRVKASTLGFYRRQCEYMIPHIGGIALGKLEPRHVRVMLAELARQGLQPQSVAHVRAVLANSLGMAVKDRIIRDNPAALADAPRVERYQAHALSADEQIRLLAAVDGQRRIVAYGTRGGTKTRIEEGVPPHRLAALAHLAIGLGLRRYACMTFAIPSPRWPRRRGETSRAYRPSWATPTRVPPCGSTPMPRPIASAPWWRPPRRRGAGKVDTGVQRVYNSAHERADKHSA